MTRLLAAIGLMLALAAPVSAARAAEIDCIIERTPAPLKAELEKIAVRIVLDSSAIPGGEAEISDRLASQRDACAATHRWSDGKAKVAMDYAIATLLRGVLRSELARRNVSLSAVDGVIAANPAVFNPAIGETSANEQQANKVIADALAAGLPVDQSEASQMLMTYFGAVAISNQIALEFDAA